jgi:hypothetical protein
MEDIGVIFREVLSNLRAFAFKYQHRAIQRLVDSTGDYQVATVELGFCPF